MSYECWAYKDNKPYKMVYVDASSKEEAISKAFEKFQKLEIKFDFIKAK